MKAEILKLAGVKNEKEFYKKFPTEKSFMAKHGKKLAKLQEGKQVPSEEESDVMPKEIQRAEPQYVTLAKVNVPNLPELEPQIVEKAPTKKTIKMPDIDLGNVTTGILGGIDMIKSQKKNIKKLDQYGQLADLATRASAGPLVQDTPKYVRPEDVLVNPINPYGSGTNYLAAENGIKIAPDVYPLTPANVKEYKRGGRLKKAQFGEKFGQGADAMSGALGGIGAMIGGGGEVGGGGMIGSTIGQTVGSLIPIPGASAALSLIGGLAGSIIGGDRKRKEQIENAQEKMSKNLLGAQAANMFQGALSGFAEDGAQIGMGGDLMIGRGKAKVISSNPYSGDTIEFVGPSHKRGGIPISYGGNPVEVEGGEPATVMRDGGGVDSLQVNGNLTIPDWLAEELEDKKAVGMKDKQYAKLLSKIDNKAQRNMDKGIELINSANIDNPFDQLSINTGIAKAQGAAMMFKDTNNKRMILNAGTDAIRETADEFGLESASLAKKNIVASKGASVKKAEYGIKLQNGGAAGKFNQLEKLAESKLQEMYPGKKVKVVAASSYRTLKEQDDLFKSGKTPTPVSIHNFGGARDYTIYVDGKMISGKDEDNLQIYKDVLWSSADELGLHTIGKSDFNHVSLVKEGYNADPFTELKNNYPELFETTPARDSLNYLQNNRNLYSKYNEVFNKLTGAQSQPVEQVVQQPMEQVVTQPTTMSTDSWDTPVGYVDKSRNVNDIPWSNDLEPIVRAPRQAPEEGWDPYTGEPRKQDPSVGEVTVTMPWSNEERYWGDLLEVKSIAPKLKNAVTNIVAKERAETDKKVDKVTPALQSILSAAQPFLNKVKNPLDPTQLYPELLAASMNQLEPVQAQKYVPQLTDAISISLQDQLNEVTAQSRAAERMAAYNPEAAANIFAQSSQIKNRILGEQFRLNQAEKQRVQQLNAQTLNDAQLKNLALMDQQYVRQAEARSKTKAQAVEISKSIADKMARNKAETIQLQTAQNMYPTFRFTSEGVAYKSPFQQTSFNIPEAGMTAGASSQIPEGYEQVTTLRKVKENGGIVKAMKNL